MDQEKIGNFIANKRKEKNMTQQELADKLGVTDRAIGNWENGRRMPDISIMKELCDVLDITINELIEGKELSQSEEQTLADKNIISILTTKSKLENMQILTEILIFIGIIISITLTSILATTTIERIITLIIGSFVWLFGIVLRVKLKKTINKLK